MSCFLKSQWDLVRIRYSETDSFHSQLAREHSFSGTDCLMKRLQCSSCDVSTPPFQVLPLVYSRTAASRAFWKC